MKLETMMKRKEKLESEILQWHCDYDNLRISNSTRQVEQKMQWRLAKLKHDIAEKLKETDEYKQHLQLKSKFAEYGIG